MNAAAQLNMFEPEGQTLAELVATHKRNAEFELRKSINLEKAGYHAASVQSCIASEKLFELAAECEMALQFEQLAGVV